MQFGRNSQQLRHFCLRLTTIRKESQLQPATISFGRNYTWAYCQEKSDIYGNLQKVASGNWQQLGKPHYLWQQLRKI